MYRTAMVALALVTSAPVALAQQRTEAVVFVSTGEFMIGHPADPGQMRAPNLDPSDMLRLPTGEYPEPARRAGRKGDVMVTVRIGADDRILGCRVTAPSAFADLNGAACAIVQRRARFKHALANDGTPREANMRVKVEFDISVPDDTSEGAIVYVPPALVPRAGDKSRRAEVLDPDMLTIRGAAPSLFPERGPIVNLNVNAGGQVTRCSIFTTSGTDQGDILSCKTVSEARYHPALNSAGMAVSSETIEFLELAP